MCTMGGDVCYGTIRKEQLNMLVATCLVANWRSARQITAHPFAPLVFAQTRPGAPQLIDYPWGGDPGAAADQTRILRI